MFQEPNEKVFIEWALVSIEDAKKYLDKYQYSCTKSHIMCAVSYLQSAIQKLKEKGA